MMRPITARTMSREVLSRLRDVLQAEAQLLLPVPGLFWLDQQKGAA